jgi:hypothetical protein
VAVRHARPPRSSPSSRSDPDSGRIAVPHLVLDPIASLQPYPVVVTVAGQDFEIPALTAAEWLAILMEEPLDPEEIFPGLVEGADDFVDDALLNGSLTLEELYSLPLDIITVASGRKWYITLRLISVAKGHWDLLGAEFVIRHIDATALSLAAWLDALLLTILRNMEPKNITMFTLKLEAPLENAQEEELPEMDRDAFLSMA